MPGLLQFLTATTFVRSLPAPADESNPPGVDIPPFYYPKVSQDIISESSPVSAFGPGLAALRSTSSGDADLKFGRKEIMQRLGISKNDFVITKSHTDNAGVVHVYASELVNGIPVDNHNVAVHVKNGVVIAFSSSFTSSQAKLVKRSISVAPAAPSVSIEEAVKTASEIYKAPVDKSTPKLVYVSIPSGDLVLAYQFQLRDDTKSLWYQISVDSTSGKVIQVINYYNKFMIKAITLPKASADEGFDVLQNPFHPQSSPIGWGGDSTEGNNVISMIDLETFKGTSDLDFTNYEWQMNEEPDSENNKKAAIVNNFYISNVVHDITYQYGFDEASGNFQNDK